MHATCCILALLQLDHISHGNKTNIVRGDAVKRSTCTFTTGRRALATEVSRMDERRTDAENSSLDRRYEKLHHSRLDTSTKSFEKLRTRKDGNVQ